MAQFDDRQKAFEEKYAHDTEKANNEAVMTAPVKGRPSVLYVEGGVLREPGSASYMQKALEHEDIDVEVRGPRSLPSTTEEYRKFDMVLVSDVPAHFMLEMSAWHPELIVGRMSDALGD